ncbi:MAG: SusC/RagA family TonB-linked outer membrane protein [Candidatus Cyclobacteriaceae bacterium M3_2C_046]
MKRVLLLVMSSMMLLNYAWAQNRTISGTVTSEEGESIPGVNVVFKGTSSGTVTDVEGNYTIQMPQEGATTLVFSFIGLQSKSVEVGNQSVIDVVLTTDVTQLNEVVVVAYGTAKKTSYTGSASVIDAEDIAKIQSNTIMQAVQGTTAGVQVNNFNGQPGEEPTVRIRGVGSINASSDPLYVVDGVPYGGNLNSLNPNDIESMTVLKDAAAAALYGSRAANGVIIINTKSGSTDTEPQITFKGLYGVSSRARKEYETVGARDFMELTWEAIRNSYANDTTAAVAAQWASEDLVPRYLTNDPTSVLYSPFYDQSGNFLMEPVGTDGRLVSGANALYETDWVDAVTQNANRQEYQLGITGGGENSSYYISAGYMDADGLALTSKFERYTGRINYQGALKDWLNVGMNTGLTYSEQNFPTSSGTSFSNVYQFGRYVSSIFPIYRRDALNGGNFILEGGERKIDYGPNRPVYDNANPVGSTQINLNSYVNNQVSSNFWGEVNFLENFKFKSTFNIDYLARRESEYMSPEFGSGMAANGRLYKRANERRVYTFNQVLTYDKTIMDQHNLQILAGHEAYNYKYEFLRAHKTDFVAPNIYELAAAATEEGSTSYTNEHRIESYFGQVTLDLFGKYNLSGSYRTDGSSRFQQDVRWGDFWSIGGAWQISEEPFMANTNFVDLLKLRASYGLQGNEMLERTLDDGTRSANYYPWQGLYDVSYPNGNNPGMLLLSLANPFLTWESIGTTTIGLDFSLFNRITGYIDYFQRNTSDMLFAKPLPPSSGMESIDVNFGDMVNRGWEVELQAAAISNQSFSWDIGFNITQLQNEITKLPQDGIINGSKRWEVGRDPYEFYIREYAGVDPETGEALYWDDEIDADTGLPTGERIKVGDDDYSEAERYYVGSAMPDVYGGFNNSFQFKGFDFSFLLTYSFGAKLLDYDYQGLVNGGSRIGNNWHVDILDRWTEGNTDTDVPRLTIGNNNSNATSTRFLYNADYIRLRNITFGYTLPQNLLKNLGMGQARIFVTADNLLTFAPDLPDGTDPEVGLAGITDNRASAMKTFSVGVNVGF